MVARVPQLRGGAGENRLGKDGVVPADDGVMREGGVAHGGADFQAAIRQPLDAVERKAVDVHHALRRFDVELHQIDQRGAAGEEPDAGALLRRGRFGLSGDRGG